MILSYWFGLVQYKPWQENYNDKKLLFLIVDCKVLTNPTVVRTVVCVCWPDSSNLLMWSILNNASNSSLVNSCPVAFFSSMLSELPGPESCDSSSESLTCDFSSFPTASIQMFSEGGETSLTVEDKMSHFVLVLQ